MIEKHIGKSNTFSNNWKNVVYKTTVPMVGELDVTVYEFYKTGKRENSPPFILLQIKEICNLHVS